MIAADAIGPENDVIGVGMPGPYSSEGSVNDARELAKKLGIRFDVLRITDIFEHYKSTLHDVFKGYPEDVTEENIQSRIRGSLLMALSNKFGALVLEHGQQERKWPCWLLHCSYGDMAGGLAVINDVPKTLVYRLSRYANSRKGVIPQATLDKPPSAELRARPKGYRQPAWGLTKFWMLFWKTTLRIRARRREIYRAATDLTWRW